MTHIALEFSYTERVPFVVRSADSKSLRALVDRLSRIVERTADAYYAAIGELFSCTWPPMSAKTSVGELKFG